MSLYLTQIRQQTLVKVKKDKEVAEVTKSTLTEEEKWYFDLHGFLVLKGIITSESLKQCLILYRTG